MDSVKFQRQKLATLPDGTEIALEKIGGKLYQPVKIVIGADGSNDGDVSVTNPLPITNVRTDMEGGGTVVIGLIATAVTFTGVPTSVIISALSGNTGTIYIGKSDVLSSGANAFTYLEAGESLTIEYNDTTNALYAVSSVSSQIFCKGALL